MPESSHATKAAPSHIIYTYVPTTCMMCACLCICECCHRVSDTTRQQRWNFSISCKQANFSLLLFSTDPSSRSFFSCESVCTQCANLNIFLLARTKGPRAAPAAAFSNASGLADENSERSKRMSSIWAFVAVRD